MKGLFRTKLSKRKSLQPVCYDENYDSTEAKWLSIY